MSRVLFNENAKDKILEGVNLVANAVKPTLGPQARTVILETKPYPTVINDGVSIAKFVSSDDPFVQMGIELVQSVASTAQLNAGDGTTTACVLAQSIIEQFNNEDIVKENVASFKHTLNIISDRMCEILDTQSIAVDNNDVLKDVATIAANNDEELGGLIAQVIKLAGQECTISVEESSTTETSIDIVEGLEIDRGMVSHSMINHDNGSCVFNNPFILMTNEDIKHIEDMMPYLEHCVNTKRPLLIMARDVTGTALGNIVVNILRKTIECCVIKAPSFGDNMVEEMEDIATIVGGQVINTDSGMDITKANTDYLGMATKAVITKDKTIITVEVSETLETLIDSRVEKIQTRLEETDEKYEIIRLKKRIAKLKGGVARIIVGASTEIEMRERKERLDDALNATQAAIQQGIVVGGGKGILEAWAVLENEIGEPYSHLMRNCLQMPYLQIMQNAGVGSYEMNRNTIYELDKHEGFNALTLQDKVNLIEAGIIDPVKVTKSSLRTAISIALLVLTTEVAVIRKDEDDTGNQGLY
tara:strand:- start:8011 stop:9603 length:1593 start_codon:yes stop_codon:yes gene_type:complete